MSELKFTYKHIHNPNFSEIQYFIQNAFERGQISNYEHSKLKEARENYPFDFIALSAWFPSVITVCVAKDSKGNEVGVGYSFCNRKDNFNKKVGRMIAKNRAISGLTNSKNVVS